MGFPFRTKQINNKGLTFPSVTEWPNFICEGCTVRAVVNRELHSREDYVLMVLERMRFIDIAHRWAPGTHGAYQPKLRYLRRFQNRFPGLHILEELDLSCPPHSKDIPVMWAEEAYSLRPGRDDDASVAYGTVRSLRSAVSQYEAMKALQSCRSLLLDRNNRLLFQDCRITDGAAHSFWTSGFGYCFGTNTTPAVALLMRHVVWLDTDFQEQSRTALLPDSQRIWSLAR